MTERRYVPDERSLFCELCGRSGVRHYPSKRGLLCDAPAPELHGPRQLDYTGDWLPVGILRDPIEGD